MTEKTEKELRTEASAIVAIKIQIAALLTGLQALQRDIEDIKKKL